MATPASSACTIRGTVEQLSPCAPLPAEAVWGAERPPMPHNLQVRLPARSAGPRAPAFRAMVGMRTCSLVACALAALCVSMLAPNRVEAYVTLADVERSPTPIVWERTPTVALDTRGLTEAEIASFDAALRASAATWNANGCASDGVMSVSPAAEAPDADIIVRRIGDKLTSGFDATAAGSTDVVMASTPDGRFMIVGATVWLNDAFDWGDHPQPQGSD